MIVSGYLMMGLCIIVMSSFTGIIILFVLNALIGVANILYYVAIRTTLQKKGSEMITELFALQSAVMRFSMVIAMGLSGILLDLLNLTSDWMLRSAGFIFIIIGVWGLISLKKND